MIQGEGTLRELPKLGSQPSLPSGGHERYLAVAEYGGGGKKGFIVVPGGRGGKGSHSIFTEL